MESSLIIGFYDDGRKVKNRINTKTITKQSVAWIGKFLISLDYEEKNKPLRR